MSMNLGTRNYIAFSLASFAIFFDVLMVAYALFTESLGAFFFIVNVVLLLGLFVAWRAPSFSRRPAMYGLPFAGLMIFFTLVRPDAENFWLIFIANTTILILLILLQTIWAPQPPPDNLLNFDQPLPTIDQDMARRFRRKLKIGQTDRTILLYGNPTKDKNFELTLKALPIICDLVTDTKVHLLITTWGNQTATKRLKNLARKLDIIENLRFIKTIDPKLLKYAINLAEIIVFPYHPKATNIADLNTTIPYLKALIVTDTPLFSQLVNGKNCLKLRNTKDPYILAASIERLLRNEQLLLKLGFNLVPPKE